LLGVSSSYTAVLSDTDGEVAPANPVSDALVEHYEHCNPSTDARSKQIQDDLRREAAIAVAGEIAERKLTSGTAVAETELLRDRELARCRASFVHFWIDHACRRDNRWDSDTGCRFCETFLHCLRSVVNDVWIVRTSRQR
jgi:hypothetical protein